MTLVNDSPLGKKSSYIATYQPDLLFPILRKQKRDEIHVPVELPFYGADIWNGFEISWLNTQGKPIVVIGEFIFSCTSPCIIESKSFKLYLNSFNNSQFESIDDVSKLMTQDLSKAAGEPVKVKLLPLHDSNFQIVKFEGEQLDLLDVKCDTYLVAPHYLTTSQQIVSEVFYSDLLKSNCLVTGQPDWGSVQISYSGNKIAADGLLKYIVSFRNHNEFHEQCVERIFMDILKYCAPEKLTVYARYTRRGGLDINPYRSTNQQFVPINHRLCRQ